MRYVIAGIVLLGLLALVAVAHDEWHEELMDARGALEWLDNVNDKLRAENAELRELVADMWFWHYCGYIDKEPQERQMEHIDGVINRMRELGVEVE